MWNGQIALHRGEFSRLDDVGHDVGADLGDLVAQFAHGGRREIGAGDADEQAKSSPPSTNMGLST